MIKTYYDLTKPGIIYGNAVTAIGGFFLAEQGHFDLGLFVSMLIGLSLIIASGCVFNNYLDREIDSKMARTQNRALVAGLIPVHFALVYGAILGLLGAALLGYCTNLLTLYIAVLGFVVYVAIYGFWKRRSEFGTIVGSIAGAVPPVVGYTAVTNKFDLAALLLFLILVFWQMPHFYAIAIRRSDDYKAAGLPVLPLKKGVLATKWHMLGYILCFIITCALLSIHGYTGYTYLLIILLLGLRWLRLALAGFQTKDDILWARQLFKFSLIILLAFSVLISLNTILP